MLLHRELRFFNDLSHGAHTRARARAPWYLFNARINNRRYAPIAPGRGMGARPPAALASTGCTTTRDLNLNDKSRGWDLASQKCEIALIIQASGD